MPRQVISMTVYKTENGTWRAQVIIGRDANGKRKRRSGNFKTKREAQVAERKWLDIARPDAYVKERITLCDYIYERYLPLVKEKVRYNTLKGYERDINNYILPALANTELQSIQERDVQSLINTCKTYKIAKNVRDTLRQILNCAMKDKYIENNPATSTNLVLPKREVYPEDHNGLWLTSFDEHDEYIAQIDDEQFKLVVMLGLSLGLRKGEIFGLNWEHVDFDKRLVHVCQTYVRESGGHKLMPPKTKKSDRYIPLRKSAAIYLKQLWIDRDCPKGAICIDDSGKRDNPLNCAKRWQRYTKNKNLAYVSLLNLRHSFATACLNAGIDITQVSRCLGHTSIETTMNRYVRFRANEMVELFDNHID